MTRIGKGTLALIGVLALLALGVGSALAAGGPRAGQGTPQGAGQGIGAQHGAGYGVMAGGVVLDAAAGYIGISEAQLAALRHDGQSLAQIATAHDKSVTGLETALVTAFKAHLDQLVTDGRLTTAQADQALANFKAQVSTIVQRTATGPAGRGGGGPMGGGGLCRWQ